MISIAEHPIARLNNSPCSTCGKDTMHRGLQCLACGVDHTLSRPTVPYKYGGKAKPEKQSTPGRDLGMGRREASAELWMAGKLHCKSDLQGVTTHQGRMDTFRRIIAMRHLEDVAAGRHRGRDETWRELFLRIYREPL